MKTLLIDNYDSYTHILAQYVWEVNGERPIVVKNDRLTALELRDLPFDNVIISPGPGRPERAGDFGVCGELIAGLPDTPIFGVCLGHQGLAACFGARVVHAPRVMHGKRSQVEHDGTGLFEGVPSPFAVVRYHSLVVDERDLPAGVEVTARTRGEGLIMGLKIKDRPFYGVQFHPESVGTEHGRRIVENFRALSERARRERRPSSRSAAGPRARVHWRELAWVDPERAFAGLFAGAPYAFWLDSSSTAGARFSFAGSADEALESRGSRVTLRRAPEGGGPVPAGGAGEVGGSLPEREGAALAGEAAEGNPFVALRRLLASAEVEPHALPFDFAGGLVGYLGYELKEHLGFGPSAHAPRALPDCSMMVARRFLAFDHERRAVYACAVDANEARARAWLDGCEAELAGLPELDEPRLAGAPPGFAEGMPVEQSLSRAEYLGAVGAALAQIREGETYEVCLSNEFRLPFAGDAFGLYRVLRRTNPAPMSAFLKTPDGAVLSSSPERFLSVDRARRVRSEPIKGTRPRGATGAETRALRDELAASDKDRSELLMITDLVRNDLARVCARGTVGVEAFARVTEYATVLQLSSAVAGELLEGRGALDAVEACFPAGSITGAPKHRTIALIDELERRARGVYTGAIGYLGFDGAADLNVAIRTMVVDRRGVSFGSGGAVVAESDPAGEYEEILVKRFALLRALYLAGRADGAGRAGPDAGRAA